MSAWHIDRFDTTLDIPRRLRMYEAIKARVLEARKFSVFEATKDAVNARIFTQLCRDPEIETFDLGYPWTGVRRKPLPPPPETP